MQAPLDTGFGDIEVRVVRRENHRTVAFDEVLRRAAWQSRIQHDMARGAEYDPTRVAVA
jgi:hypothetical protein